MDLSNPPSNAPPAGTVPVSRRIFLATSAVAGATAGLEPSLAQQIAAPAADGTAQHAVRMTVNAAAASLRVDPRVTLLDALRDHLDLPGTKKGCDHGQCGACTVLVNGRRINSCLSLAVMHEGDTITTIEGIGSAEAPHPMQAAFIRHDGFQCGYCTPGQICSSIAMLQEIGRGVPSHATPDLMDIRLSDDELRERMSGNLCRCAAYNGIVAAIHDVGTGAA